MSGASESVPPSVEEAPLEETSETPLEEAALLEEAVEEVVEEPSMGSEPSAPAAVLAPPPAPAPAPPSEPVELFGKDAIRDIIKGARYPLGRERLLAFLQGKRVNYWRGYPVPLDELIGLSHSSVFHSEEEVLAVCDAYLKNKPSHPIFSTQYGRG